MSTPIKFTVKTEPLDDCDEPPLCTVEVTAHETGAEHDCGTWVVLPDVATALASRLIGPTAEEERAAIVAMLCKIKSELNADSMGDRGYEAAYEILFDAIEAVEARGNKGEAGHG